MKVKVLRRNGWQELPDDRPVVHIEADHRVEVDVDPRGKGWARIVRGNDSEVCIDVTYGGTQ
jgi:hypothetical protein